ncbi:MAG: ABC transporter permease subunit [Planctomycetota bacterium]|nr:ABC transporter permease subunit [Planctomycetota bacterium]
MSLRDLNRRHLGLISVYATRYAVRGGAGLVFVLIVLFFGLMVANFVISPVEELKRLKEKETGREIDTEELLPDLVNFVEPGVAWFLDPPKGGDDEVEEEAKEWAAFLMHDRPALLSLILLVLTFTLPFLVGTGAFNQYSGDVGSRGIRYQLLRTERANIYFGRFIGTYLFCVLTLAFLVATIVLYVGLKLDVYSWGSILGWGFWGFVALAIVSMPYTALCGWVSSFVDSAFGSLCIVAVILGGVPFFAWVGSKTWEPASNVKYVLPWGVQEKLLHYETSQVVVAILACLGYTLVFLALGYRHFSKRDL